MKTVVVIAPHPDDETLGCGGTLLKHYDSKDSLVWIIVTSVAANSEMGKNFNYENRNKQILSVAKEYNFSKVYELNFPAAQLDIISKSEIITKISDIFNIHKPDTVYLPFPGDAHSDHLISFEAGMACCKSFRNNCIKIVAAYETISETDFGLNPCLLKFNPNMYVDISNYIDKKIKIMNLYESEVSCFPFPRSPEAIIALSQLRGSQCGVKAAESFMLIKYIC